MRAVKKNYNQQFLSTNQVRQQKVALPTAWNQGPWALENYLFEGALFAKVATEIDPASRGVHAR